MWGKRLSRTDNTSSLLWGSTDYLSNAIFLFSSMAGWPASAWKSGCNSLEDSKGKNRVCPEPSAKIIMTDIKAPYVCSCLPVFQVLALPDLVERPGRLHGCWHCRAGAHQHGTVDVGCHHQDAEEDGPDDGPLQTQIISSACHCQACQIRMPAPYTQTKNY